MGVNIFCSAHLPCTGPLKPQEQFFLQKNVLLVLLGKGMVNHSFCSGFPLCHPIPWKCKSLRSGQKGFLIEFHWN